MRLPLSKFDSIALTMIIVPLTLSPLCLLLLVRLVGYIVNVYTFYSCRLIGKLTAFLQNSFRSSASVNQLALAPHGVPCQDFSVRVVALRTAAPDPLEFVSRSYASDQSRFRFQWICCKFTRTPSLHIGWSLPSPLSWIMAKKTELLPSCGFSNPFISEKKKT